MKIVGILGSVALLGGLVLPALADDLVNPNAAVLIEGWKHRVWVVDPPEKLKATEPLPTDRTVKTIRITAARGEAEPVLLVVRAEGTAARC